MKFPHPLTICIGGLKGGITKTWHGANLGTMLGAMKYHVLALDLNPQKDLLKTVCKMMRVGEDAMFHVHQNPHALETSDHGIDFNQYDFIVYDTSNFFDYPSTPQAYKNAHILLVPLTQDEDHVPNYLETIKLFRSVNAQAPIIGMPAKTNPLANGKDHQRYLTFLRNLHERHQLIIPPTASTNDESVPVDAETGDKIRMMYFNSSIRGRSIRSLAATENEKKIKDKFIKYAIWHFEWVIEQIVNRYGPLPDAKLESLSTISQLKDSPLLPEILKEIDDEEAMLT
jgi:hypothetical protein